MELNWRVILGQICILVNQGNLGRERPRHPPAPPYSTRYPSEVTKFVWVRGASLEHDQSTLIGYVRAQRLNSNLPRKGLGQLHFTQGVWK
jgi:hypothetical protein